MSGAVADDFISLRHGRTRIALHVRKRAPGPNLLLLHALRSSNEEWTQSVDVWPGSIFALDFSGHGESQWRQGGVYSPELLLGDADAALRELGDARIVGAGVGAYVALLLAGVRADSVRGALLLAGEGLAGGGSEPDSEPDADAFEALLAAHRAPLAEAATDPRVLMADTDIRPTNYAFSFGSRATSLLLGEDETSRPPWWEGLRSLEGVQVVSADLADGLLRLWKGGGATQAGSS